MKIGNRIKEIRTERGLTQEELADRAELSKGFISQIERDLTSPSIATLEDILMCLGIEINDFFSYNTETKVVFKYDEYFEKKDDEHKNIIEWVIPNAQKNKMEPIRMTLKPGGSTIFDNPHEGEEFGYLIKGDLTVYIGNRKYKVMEGESFYYKSDKVHYLSSDVGAELIWVSSPPSF
ncbi:MAG: helix-turn-helix domain-containing protein [Peptostreptococcaceae bacterium]|nr:helix-turn-helix domain-containing protein [Peptostreptococcaceae bacterium]